MVGDHVGTLGPEHFSPILADTANQHMPRRCQASGTPGIEPGTSAFSLPRVVAQLGIEPMTTRCLMVALATKLLGQRKNTPEKHKDTKKKTEKNTALFQK